MNTRESVGVALTALRSHLLRSALTLVGVIIGVASVIAVMSVVQGLERYVSDQLSAAGGDVFTVDRVGIEFDFTRVRDKQKRPILTIEHADAVRRGARTIAAVAASGDASTTVRRETRELRRVALSGKEPDYMRVEDLPVAAGRPLEERDQRARAQVCVIGAEVASELFGPLDPLGREIRVGERRFTVVGVGERLGSSFGQPRDLYCLIPLSTWQKIHGRSGSLTLHVRALGPAYFERAQDEVRAQLRVARGLAPGAPDDFEIVTPDMYLGLYRDLSGALSIVLIGVSLIALVVGGIVIMNIMLVSVTERTREIGLRMAVGARRRDILTQFLLEACTLSLVGGAIGLVIGGGFSLLLGVVTPLPAFVSPLAVVLGVLMSTLVGVFFGAYPAARAARLDPIEALRRE